MRPIRFDIMCGEMNRRVLIALASFWGAGVLALLVVSDPGSMTHARTYWTFFILATYGLLFGPFAFVVGAHGLILRSPYFLAFKGVRILCAKHSAVSPDSLAR